MLRKETITHDMLTMIRTLQRNRLFDGFSLVGGTALALQLGHRQSVDIDLFSTDKHDYQVILNYFNNNFSNIKIFYFQEHSLQITVDTLKIDLVSVKGNILEPPKTIEGVTMLGINDISAMKLSAIEGRKSAKDYIDIVYLLKEMSLETMFKNYTAKYNDRDIMGAKKALSAANMVNPYEWQLVSMLKNDIFISDIPRILADEAVNFTKKANKNGNESLFNIFLRNFKRQNNP